MVYKIKNNKRLKTFCLKRRLRNLESKRTSEVTEFIHTNPSLAARADNIEKNITSDKFKNIEFQIKATHRLLKKISQN